MALKFSTDLPPLHRVRKLGKTLSSKEVAELLGKSPSWPRKNRDLFITEHEGKNLKFEMSSVLEYHFKELLS